MKSPRKVTDPLFDFELKVARRADELLHESGMESRNPLEVWCEAERQTAHPFGEHVDSAEFRIRERR
jgi:hypothetical protein